MDTSTQPAVSHLVGADKAAVDTPALFVDLDILEQNIARIAGACRQGGINWRPHTKGIKVPQIARMLIEGGAAGHHLRQARRSGGDGGARLFGHPDR